MSEQSTFHRASQWSLPIFGLIALFLVWELVTGVFNIVSEHMLPSPVVITEIIIDNWDLMVMNLEQTLYSAGLGFIFAVVLGVLTGVVLALNDRINEILLPVVVASNSVPRVALAPLIIFYVGVASQAHIIIAAWIAFFPVVLNTLDGLNSVNEDMENLLDSLGATYWQEYRMVRFPVALPYIFDGMKLAVTLSIVGAVVGEFVAADFGVGALAMTALYSFNVPLAFAAIMSMAAISVIAFMALFIAQDKLLYWEDTSLFPQ